MPSSKFEKLVGLMAQLRSPGGCPWDREQTHRSLRPYLIEEVYEALDAIDRGDWPHLAEELGDLQLQIVFQAQMASEEGHFSIDDVLDHINEKLIRRHPHVFGTESIETPGEVIHRWEEIKAEEKRQKAAPHDEARSEAESILDSVPRAQPALLEARKLGKRAAEVGFDWERFDDLFEKLKEEMAELQQARASNRDDHVEKEIGDLLFMLVNIARHLNVNPELALRQTNQSFRDRFAFIERQLRQQGKSIDAVGLDELERLWQLAKNQ